MKLRVHCAEALGTPIVGDFKYGWKAHKNWEPMPCLQREFKHEKLPFGLQSEGGSVSDTQPRLHLHCRQTILPNISSALQQLESSSSLSSSSNLDLSKIDKLELLAPVPSHMRESWEILNCWSHGFSLSQTQFYNNNILRKKSMAVYGYLKFIWVCFVFA